MSCQVGGNVWHGKAGNVSWRIHQTQTDSLGSVLCRHYRPLILTSPCCLIFSPALFRVQCPRSVHVSWHLWPHADTANTQSQWFPRVQSQLLSGSKISFRDAFSQLNYHWLVLIQHFSYFKIQGFVQHIFGTLVKSVEVSFHFPGELLCSASAECSSKTMHPAEGQECRQGQACCCIAVSHQKKSLTLITTHHIGIGLGPQHTWIRRLKDGLSWGKLSRKLSTRKRMSSQEFAFFKSTHIKITNCIFLTKTCFCKKTASPAKGLF